MGRFRERHGASVTGFPFAGRVAISLAILLPGLWGLGMVLTGTTLAAWGIFLLVLDAVAIGVVFPTLWSPSADAERAEADGRRISRRLDIELGNRGPKPHRSLSGEDAPPERW